MSRWISVADKLPSPDDKVLFVAPFKDNKPLICFGYKHDSDPADIFWTDLSETDLDGDTLTVYGVTHWMPLPELPE